SSRRRHTRSTRDWSSDVCSSDLDSLAEAHMSLGEVKLFYDWDWMAAEKEFKRAIGLNPNYPDTYHFYGHYLETTGQFADAIRVRSEERRVGKEERCGQWTKVL